MGTLTLDIITHKTFHEVASIFPMMGDEEYQSLVADIQVNGLLEPIWIYQNKIIDGRNRYKACRELGIEPQFREWDGNGSLVSFVVSLNLKRRHLTSGQKGMIAVEVEQQLAVEAEKRMLAGKALDPVQKVAQGRSRDQAASIVGTNHAYVTKAKKIVAQAPELQEPVLNGTITISDAEAIAKLSKEQRSTVMCDMILLGSKAKVAILDIKKAEVEARAQAAPTKPHVTLASWETWLHEQPMCDLLVTDPPYSTDVQDIATFAQSWLPLALAKVRSTGRAYVCIGAYPHELQAYLNVQASMPVRQILVWSYKNTIGPSPTHEYKDNWQAILYFVGNDAPPLDCPIMNEQFSSQEINAPDGRLGDRYHTWQKPDTLAERLIRHSTKPGDTVLDCFAGTGTFLLAATKFGCVARGCDVSAEMLQIAEKRGCEVHHEK
jgi:hypothetical protein